MKMIAKKHPPKHVSWGLASSPAGKLFVGLTEKNEICRISFLRKNSPSDILSEWQLDWKHTQFKPGADVKNFAKKPVMMIGTDFQHKVWREMVKIPSGRVTTYGALAKKIGKAGAARAVGTACGANPVAYLVPCHRVVAANGGLGGFSGGLDVKKALLKTEGAKLK